jgi:uncharacterized membrane protein
MRTVIEDISCITMVIFYDGEYSYYIIFRIYFCLFLVSLLPVLLIIRTLLIIIFNILYHISIPQLHCRVPDKEWSFQDGGL